MYPTNQGTYIQLTLFGTPDEAIDYSLLSPRLQRYCAEADAELLAGENNRARIERARVRLRNVGAKARGSLLRALDNRVQRRSARPRYLDVGAKREAPRSRAKDDRVRGQRG